MGGTGKRILIVTCQALPDDVRPTTGGSLRAHNLGLALAECGHQVVFAVPKDSLYDNPQSTLPVLERIPYEINDLDSVIDQVGPELLLFANWGLAINSPRKDIPTITDMNGSLVLENYYRGRKDIFFDSIAKLRAFGCTDLVLAGSEAQKVYLTTWALAAGIPPGDLRIEVVPFSLAPEIPVKRPQEGLQVVMAGYDWPWLQGVNSVKAVADELGQKENCYLQLFTARPDYNDVLENEDSSGDVSGQLHAMRHERVVHHDAVCFDLLVETLAQSSLALDVWQKNPERELAFSSRTVAYLWAGLPVITGNYGELSQLIDEYQAGWLVNPENPAEIKAIIGSLMEHPATILEYQKNARRLFAERFSREKTIKPVDAFCRAPVKGRRASPLIAHLDSREQLIKNIIEEHGQKISLLREEGNLMGAVGRRPKGLSWVFQPSLLIPGLRRLVKIPLLLYLALISYVGEVLHRIWTRGNERCAS